MLSLFTLAGLLQAKAVTVFIIYVGYKVRWGGETNTVKDHLDKISDLL